MIEIAPDIWVNEGDISLDFIRSSGPGGQNVNKVASGVQLRFNIQASTTLPDEVKQRLHILARNRITEEGILIIEAKQYRTQEQNRADALLRLADLLRQASHQPKPRKKTRPSVAAKARRLDEKRRRGEIKRLRGPHASERD